MMKRRGREFWERVVAEVESGGVTRVDCARRHRVRVGTLLGWLYRLRRERGEADGGSKSGEVRLIPVEVTPRSYGSIAVELRLGHDVALRFDTGSDVGYIAALVTALRAPT
jgi:transposase-like protein